MCSGAVGIDFGTTNSCAAVYLSQKVQFIENKFGQILTKSCVVFEEDGWVQFLPAKILTEDFTPECIIFDIKRLIGRNFSDPQVQNNIKNWPFDVIRGQNGNPLVKLPNGETFQPEELSAKIIFYLKEPAKFELGIEVSNAVITVPAYFNDAQRQATRDAGEMAGLNVRIINEPTAASVAYNFQRNSPQRKIVLVFDLSESTLDVSLLETENGENKLLAIDGDAHFGRENFVDAVVQYCIEEFKKKEGIDLNAEINSRSTDQLASGRAIVRFNRLKNECEKETIYLLAAKCVYVSLDRFYYNTNLHVQIKRETLESLNMKNFDQCFDTLNRILRTVKLNKGDIDDVILVGCSSQIPLMKTKITEHFNGKTPLETIKGEQVVAYGAAIQASKFFEIEDEPQKHYDEMAQLEAKVTELFRQRGWEFDEDEVAAFHNWLECRNQ